MPQTETLLLLILGVFIFILLLVAFIKQLLLPFLIKRQNIKIELLRTSGEEHQYWKRQMKRLYIGYIPFIGKHIKRKMR